MSRLEYQTGVFNSTLRIRHSMFDICFFVGSSLQLQGTYSYGSEMKEY